MIRFEFYQNQILKFLNKDKSILVLGASSDEASLFHKLQFKRVILSNIDLVQLNFSEDFEKSALNENTYVGGVDGSNIPNYVYRWTEREIKKLFYSYQPDKKINVIFNYQNNILNENLSNDSVKKIIITFSYLFLKIIFFLFPKQQNLMSIYIDKKNYKKRIN
jgi:hypothetical protein